MARSSSEDKYNRLRRQFPYFVFEKQEIALNPEGLDIRFTFNLAGQFYFHPTLFIPRKSFFLPDGAIAGHLDNIVFNIGMIELISYWKAACAPKLIIRPFSLHPDQVTWWKKLYFNGLGEFFYLNSIPATKDNFMQVEVASDAVAPKEKFYPDAGVIIPVGGGKDSAVTLELLGKLPGSIPLIMNPRAASIETIAAMGFSGEEFIEIRRTLDPLLLQLNDEGFLNGHTPFSALLAFITVLSAILSGHRHIALSNESSASEPTIGGTTINHQYSKSLGFESGFRTYVHRWISEEINYFSFLRPLSELQIASIFSDLPRYHAVFKSCNAGSKTDSWCGQCAKCLFTWIMLSPFLPDKNLAAIFGKDLLDDPSLQLFLDQLTGIAEEKPFDCVGTIREVNLALCEAIRQRDASGLPFLLRYYIHTDAYRQYAGVEFEKALLHVETEHHLQPGFQQVLVNALQNRVLKNDRS